MKGWLAVAVLVAWSATTPASAERFFVVQDTGTGDCSIVRHVPQESDKVLLGRDGSYSSRRQAEHAALATGDCRSVPFHRELPAVALR